MSTTTASAGRPLCGVLLVVSLLFGGSGCIEGTLGLSDSLNQLSRYRSAIPDPQTLAIEVPHDEGRSNLRAGERGELYLMTYRISRGVNAHVGALLLTLRTIVQLPPTRVERNVRIWGPTEPRGLEPVSWRLMLTEGEPGRFVIELAGRPKDSPADTPWTPIISGESSLHGDALSSVGTLVLDFDAHRSINPGEVRQGAISVAWDTTRANRGVDVAWMGFVDEWRHPFPDATYAYEEAPSGAGTFVYSAYHDIHGGDPQRRALERFDVRSAWQADGQGRALATLAGEDIEADLSALGSPEAQVTLHECWGRTFGVVYADTLPAALRGALYPEIGFESSCALTVEQLPAAP
mgnify:CR=1 FL=1